MTRGDILTKVIAIAKRNGFQISDDFFTDTPVEVWLQENQDFYFSLIYCHEFVQCFFGDGSAVISDFEESAEEFDLTQLEEPTGFLMSNRKNIMIPLWQYHLMQMVISEDPLMYLSNFIPNEQIKLD